MSGRGPATLGHSQLQSVIAVCHSAGPFCSLHRSGVTMVQPRALILGLVWWEPNETFLFGRKAERVAGASVAMMIEKSQHHLGLRIALAGTLPESMLSS
mmetsp:Transcript_1680/g.2718  ORF Transcript_1680/g.2718 Transcript_1680/m.2718 type:complete len:99 (+) Transcript_1680:45-341(+)